MSSTERQLRLVQCGLIVFIVVCFFVKRMGRPETHDALSLSVAHYCGGDMVSHLRVHSTAKDQSYRESTSDAVEKVDTGQPMAGGAPSAPLDRNRSWLVGTCSALLRWSRVACQCLPWTRNAAFVDMEAGSYSRPSTTVSPVAIRLPICSCRKIPITRNIKRRPLLR